MLNTRELIARRLFVKKIKDGYTCFEARCLVYRKLNVLIPWFEAKKLEHDAMVMSIFL